MFVRLPDTWVPPLREAGWTFHTFVGHCARLMTGGDTAPTDIDTPCDHLRRAASSQTAPAVL